MSAEKPINPQKFVHRVRGTDGTWYDVEGTRDLNITIPTYMWNACIPESSGVRILSFIMN